VTVNGEVVFDRKTQGRFPEVKELKQLVRDKLAPEKYLGHSDINDRENPNVDELDDDDAAEMRAFYGVL
jgi:predicted Rdx family selenoprotein